MRNSQSKEAMFYEKLEGGRVRCQLCPHYCQIAVGKSGICRGRENKDGTLNASTFAETISLTNDPVEKKPLYHFYPGRFLLSMGPNACNLSCEHCQNWEISQARAATSHVTPERAVELAENTRDCIGLSFTYTEPLMWFEFVLETSRLARSKGVKTTLVTNGFINSEPAAELLPFIDAINLDIKSMDDDFYRSICGARLQPVLDFATQAAKTSHLEITNLVIPGLNDEPGQIQRLADWICDNLGDETALHFSRYFPRYKMRRPETPIETLVAAHKIAREKLKFVYVGNVIDDELHNTYCPSCGNLLVRRTGYRIGITGLSDGKCTKCGESIPIVT